MVLGQAELWRAVFDSRLLDVHTAMPCEVVAFDAALQTIDAQPMIKHVTRPPEGEEIVESYPRLRDIPVLYPRAGGFIIAYPLAAGDMVTVLFNEWSLDSFRSKGRETHPVQFNRHAFSGAVALPIGPYKADDTIAETIDGLVVGHDGGAVVRIKTDGTVEIGATGSTMQPIALGDDVKSELDALKSTLDNLVTAYNSHIHITTATVGAGAVPGIIAPTTSAGTPHGTVGAVGSSIAEVEE